MAKKSQKGEARKVRELMEGFTEGTLVAADLIDAVNAGGVLSALAEELLGEMVGQHNCRVNHPSAGVRHPGPVVDQPELKDRLVDGPFSLGPAGSTGPEEANGSETSDDDLAEAEIADKMTNKVMPDLNAIRDAEKLVSVMVIDLKLHPEALDLLNGPTSASLFRLASMYGGLPRG